MKTILTLLIFLSFTTTYAQTDFCKGWNVGFKEGYCYGTYGCTAPVTPPCPVPNIGNENYKGGYNQGFVAGKSKKEGTVSSTSNGGAYGQLKPLENNDYGSIVLEHMRNNPPKKTKAKVKKSPKINKIVTFDTLVKKAVLYHKFKLYSHCIEYYDNSKKFKDYNDKLEYVAGDSYLKLYQENKKKANLKKAITILNLSIEHGNQDAKILLDKIKSNQY